MRRITYIVIGIVLILLIGGYFLFRKPASPIVPATDRVTVRTVTATVSETGSIESAHDVPIASTVSGRLIALPAHNGMEVKTGDILAHLDDAIVQERIKASQATLAKAQANLELTLSKARPEEIEAQKQQIANATNTLAATQATLAATLTSLQAQARSADTTAISSTVRAQNAATHAADTAESFILDTDTLRVQIENITSRIKRVEDFIDEHEKITDNKQAIADEQVRDAQETLDLATQSEDQDALYAAQNALTLAKLNAKSVRSANDLEISTAEDQLKTLREQRDQLTSQFIAAQTRTVTTIHDAQNQSVQTESDVISAAAQSDAQKAALLIQQRNAEVSLIQAQSQLATAKAQFAILTPNLRDIDLAPARADIASATAALEEAMVNAQNYLVTAPFSGTVTQVAVQSGQTIAPSIPLMHLVDLERLRIVVNVSESEIGNVELDQSVSMTFDALPEDTILKGIVAEIDKGPTVIQGIVFYQVRVEFDSPEDISKLRPGMTVNVDIEIGRKEKVLSALSRAVKTRSGEKYVTVYKDDGTTEEREVTIGFEGDERTEVLSGLKEGERIITSSTPTQ